jgi:hypothetical protein
MTRRDSYFTILSEIEQLDERGHVYRAIEISHGSGHGVLPLHLFLPSFIDVIIMTLTTLTKS